ncbi:MAG TPA: hypothetical protein VKQ71_03115 [Acidimicrobiales bacterium]|nr:hypothetical protein [Acidimicrobiales bacterium]
MTRPEELALPARIDPSDWPELSYQLGLTDGLPTFPPDRSVVERLVAGSGLPGDFVVGAIPPRGQAGSVRAIAANAAMAGCLPEHMPVVVAAIQAMLEPVFNLRGIVCTTHPSWPLVIVSGRAVTDLQMETRESVFNGGGARANMAIGRAIRLVTWNLGGAYPRRPVQEVMGHPGRMGYCIAEEPVNTPWEPLHVARGVDAPSGAVTVFGCEAPQVVLAFGAANLGSIILARVADQMRAPGNSNVHTGGEVLVCITPSWARTLAEQGWTRRSVQEFLWERARSRLGDIRMNSDGSPAVHPDDAYYWWPDSVDQTNPDEMVPVATSPEDIHLVVTGADSLPYMAVCPSWGALGGFAITRALPEYSTEH